MKYIIPIVLITVLGYTLGYSIKKMNEYRRYSEELEKVIRHNMIKEKWNSEFFIDQARRLSKNNKQEDLCEKY